MKILNLFAGIGGNRTSWGNDHEITAVEWDDNIAEVYKRRFPNDSIIVTDAYKYLEDNFHLFDFVWASPPCDTHTQLCVINASIRYNNTRKMTIKIPDMRLYGLIYFLKHIFRGDWVVENVASCYYKPLIDPTAKIGRHYIWSNKYIRDKKVTNSDMGDIFLKKTDKERFKVKGIDIKVIEGIPNLDKKKIARNCVRAELGKYILNSIIKNEQEDSRDNLGDMMLR